MSNALYFYALPTRYLVQMDDGSLVETGYWEAGHFASRGLRVTAVDHEAGTITLEHWDGYVDAQPCADCGTITVNTQDPKLVKCSNCGKVQDRDGR